MSRFTDQAYLRDQQYRDDSNFRARAELHRRFSTNPEPWHRWVFDRLDVPAGGDVLEIGCGPGELWRANLDRIPFDWKLTLCDLSPGMLEAAREALRDRADYRVADVRDLPFEDGSFDTAIANHMLYHVPEPSQALREIARVLRHGGLVFAGTNGEDHLREIKELLPDQLAWNASFGLETGAEELAHVFSEVEVELYPGDLEVTDAQAVVAFVRSFEPAEPDELEETVTRAIAREDSFHVTKSTGLFRARKP